MDTKRKGNTVAGEKPLGYHLYLYREQLRRSKTTDNLKLSKAKYRLTTDLVVKTWKNLMSYSEEARDHLVDSVLYKKKLKQKIEMKNEKKKFAALQKKLDKLAIS